MSIDERGTPPTATRDAASTAADKSRPTGWTAVRPLLMRLHFYAGVFIGPFLLIAALTGIAYIYAPNLERAVYDQELHVVDAPTSLPLDRQVDAARAVIPADGVVKSVRPAPTGTDTTQVIYTRPGDEPSFRHTVFVDPHTGGVRGDLETYGSGQAMPLRAWIDVLHRNLHLGEPGRLYSELAASWLWVVVTLGLVLWFSNRRARRKTFAAAAGAEPSKPVRRTRALRTKGAVGVWAAVGLFILSATGLTWSGYAGENIGALREALSWSTPSVSSAVPPSPAGADVGLQAVRDATQRAGLADPVEIVVPAEPGKGYVVNQVGRGLPNRLDSMAVDPATGEVTDTLRFADYPLMAKLTRWGIDGHMGLLFGWPNQVLLTLFGLGLVALVGYGYRMWWLRRPTRGRAWGRAPRRGAWRQVPPAVLVPLVLVFAALAWAMPVFGVSLLVFLVVDLAVGYWKRVQAEVAQY
ncbi:PepSY-associated TM helix domain-containing protein [Actinokineospora bangkokensis]|uniref:Peptidase n=1 Tax=Actinokineospora bangkokensis TaxID=1193682 RepID=A0A1Q9LLG4_9PSEU|nr:PepSY-associated TM helix domain-containing protein [Actinokineospora bangkokensis]OLR92834.1 peptidase [Actinokineospora bangkokensis]